MKNIFCLFLLICGIQAQAQFSEEGYIVTNAGDTIQGKIKSATPSVRTVRCVFEDTKGEETRYEPFQIQAFYLKKSNQHFESKLFRPTLELSYGYGVFMERKENGYVRIYEYWNTDKERGYLQIFLQRGNENIMEVNYLSFKKQLIRYFDDFPQLAAKIERGAFKKKHLNKIVKEYNEWNARGF